MHRIPLPLPHDGLRAVNVYAIRDGDDLVLVDAGWALDVARGELVQALAQIGCRLRDITRFLVTHLHRDHYTQAVTIRREVGTPVAIGIGERPSLMRLADLQDDRWASQVAQLRLAGAQPVIDRLRAGSPEKEPASDWEWPDVWLHGRERVPVGGRTLLPLHTPGHTRGHMVFADEAAGLLFAGDHVLPHITPSIGFEAAPHPHALGTYLRSLAAVRQLPDMSLLPAHGPVTGSVHARVDQLLGHHDRRLQDCLAAVQAGAGTAYQAARRLRWTRRSHRFDELDTFNQMLAAIETLAHLELLAVQGRLERHRVDGTATYEVSPLR